MKGNTMTKTAEKQEKPQADKKPAEETKPTPPTTPASKPLDLAPMRHVDPANKNSVMQITRDVLVKYLKGLDGPTLQRACAVLEIPTTGKADVLRRRIIMRQCGGRMEYVASGTICAGCYNVVAITHTHEKYRRYKCTSCGRRGEIRCD